MSPASTSKSKDKKVSKEPAKGLSKTPGHVNTISGTPASGYNPVLGTFHTIDTAPSPSAGLLHANSRFQNVDDSDDHNGNVSGAGIEYDSVSNNDSWSVESEDHKEKSSQPPSRTEVPGADNEKREKIRQKNEKKHQRQKERRAQELHERCTGFLMSRKLDVLAQQLVAMGFSQERATMALILNEGRVQESVSWLLEFGEEDKQRENNLDRGGNLRIDISDELAHIREMEIRYKASKQEVERVIVSCEGDLVKAEETLKTQKEEPPTVPSNPKETGDSPAAVSNSRPPIMITQNPVRIQPRSTSSSTAQSKMDEKDFNYTKSPATVGSSMDPGGKTMQMLKKIPPKSDWTKPQQIPMPAEKRWTGAGSNPSASYLFASPLSPPAAKIEASYVAIVNELNNLQLGSMKEPVVVMQRPQSVNGRQSPSTSISSSPPAAAMGWYPNSFDAVKPHGFAPNVAVSRSLSPNDVSSNPLSAPLHYQSQQQHVPSSSSMDSTGTIRANGLWARGNASPGLNPPSSLGLFTGTGGTSGSSPPVDWNTGNGTFQFDYTSIDWSLDRGSLSSKPNGLWTCPNYPIQNNSHTYSPYAYGRLAGRSVMRPILSNGNGGGLQDEVPSSDPSGSGSREWTSPFEERDIFSLPRQYVTSPSP